MYNFCLDFFSIDKSLLGLLSAECPRAWMSLIIFQAQQNHIVCLNGQFYNCSAAACRKRNIFRFQGSFCFYFLHLTLRQDIRAAESFPFGLL